MFFKKKPVIKFHEDTDTAFKPLIDFLSDWSNEDTENTLNQYMYMCHDDEKTYYKHFGNREYFNVFNNGSTEGDLEDWRNWYD